MEMIGIEENKYIIRGVTYNSSNSYNFLSGSIGNTIYTDCLFDGILFDGISYSGVEFEGCKFLNSKFSGCKNTAFAPVVFNGCELINVEFTGCNMPGTTIKSTCLNKCLFKDCYLRSIRMTEDIIEDIYFQDNCNLMDCNIDKICRYMRLDFINEKAVVKLNYGSHIGDFIYKNHGAIKEESSNKYIDISNSYMNLAKQFELNNIPRKYGDCFYKCRKAMNYTFRGVNRIISVIYDISCGYGEKPERAFLMSLFIILFFALVYALTGIKTSEGVMAVWSIKSSGTMIIDLLIKCIYFSTVTFATVGYGDFVPFGISGEIAAILEILSGIVMVGILTSTLIGKITR